jgi:hypothetical protein
MLYDFALTEAQRLQTETYLMRKWFGASGSNPVTAGPAAGAGERPGGTAEGRVRDFSGNKLYDERK